MSIFNFKKVSLNEKLSLLGVLVLLGGLFFSVNNTLQNQQSKSNAATTTESATTVCSGTQAVIKVSFTNPSGKGSQTVSVKVLDAQTGISTNLGAINVGKTQTGNIATNRSTLAKSGVIFFVTGSGRNPTINLQSAVYNAITCPTAVPTVTPTPTPTPNTAGPTPTINPGVSLAPGTTGVSLNLLLDGIGMAGDRAHPGTAGNLNPLHQLRSVTVQVYNSSNTLVESVSGLIIYQISSGSFTGTVGLGLAITSGSYTVKVTVPQYLTAQIPGIQTITQGQVNQTSMTSLITGDINGDNVVNIEDYNILIGCYSDLLPAANCPAGENIQADLDDDGHVNQTDYNLFIRELTNINGQ